MPIYNTGIYLQTAIESILNQTFRDFELILVDDGSTDGSSELCDKYAKKDLRVKVLHQENGGICNARNVAIKHAQGYYLAFADHDDEYLPDFLAHAYSEASTYNADLVKVGKKEYIINGAHIQREMESHLLYRILDRADIKDAYFSLVDNRTLDCVWDGLYKRELLERYDILFDEAYKHGGEDIDFNQRFLRYTSILVTIDRCYYLHYIRRGFSTSSKFCETNILMFDKKMAVIEETIRSLHIPIEENKFDYTYLLFRQYIVNVCAYYSSRQLDMSFRNRRQALAKSKESPFYKGFCDNQLVAKFFKRNIKYGILYFFFKYQLYCFVLRLF